MTKYNFFNMILIDNEMIYFSYEMMFSKI